MFYPRLASAAEVAWSPARRTHPERTWGSFASRVAGLGPLWEGQGIALRRDPGIDCAVSRA